MHLVPMIMIGKKVYQVSPHRSDSIDSCDWQPQRQGSCCVIIKCISHADVSSRIEHRNAESHTQRLDMCKGQTWWQTALLSCAPSPSPLAIARASTHTSCAPGSRTARRQPCTPSPSPRPTAACCASHRTRHTPSRSPRPSAASLANTPLREQVTCGQRTRHTLTPPRLLACYTSNSG